jgi:hypothetical protein
VAGLDLVTCARPPLLASLRTRPCISPHKSENVDHDGGCRIGSCVAAHLGAASAQTTTCDGLPISTPVQAFLDLASLGVNLVDLVIAGDSLVKANDLDPQEFVAAAAA